MALGRPVYPLLALCGLLALCSSRSTTRGGQYVNVLQLETLRTYKRLLEEEDGMLPHVRVPDRLMAL